MDNSSTTIEVSSTPEISEGDTLSIPFRENRWWVRSWYFLTFRKAPDRHQLLTVTGITAGGSTLNVTSMERDYE